MDYDDCRPKQIFYDRVECNPMDVLYERRCAKYIYVVPEGLRELMSDISREVLRCQPKEIYCFIADYLDALMITRENARVAALFVEDVTEAGSTLRDILYRTNLTLEQAVRAVRIIQRAFRRHLSIMRGYEVAIEPIDPHIIICKMMLRLNISYDKASGAAKIIQHAWRIYKLRMDNWRRRFDNAVDWREAARYTLRMYKKYAATYEYTKAATIIQSAYRGYYTRRLLKQYARRREKVPEYNVWDYLIEHYKETGEEEESMYNKDLDSLQTLYVMYDPEDKAARIIQRTFRKYIRNKTEQVDHIVADDDVQPVVEDHNEELGEIKAEEATVTDDENVSEAQLKKDPDDND